MAKKIGRNEPCWCGSGKKYKYCHLRREREKPITFQESIRAMRKAFGKEYCLHAEASPSICSGNIIKAHTIQRNGGLSQIARKGHVFTYSPELFSLNSPTEYFEPKLIGIKVASTFTGFCAAHDQTTFAPIEARPFAINEVSAFLFGYRGLCKELFAKRASVALNPFFKELDRGMSIDEQYSLQNFMNNIQSGEAAGLVDYETHKSAYDKVIISQDYRTVHYYAITFNHTPDLLCSGAVYPEYSFNGERLQNLYQLDQPSDIFSYSLITSASGGAAIFTWVGESTICNKLIASLHAISDSEVPHALVRFTFDHFDNVFLKPDWWDSLTIEAKSNIFQRVLKGLSLKIIDLKNLVPDYYVDDRLRSVKWHVSGRLTNLQL